MPKDKQLHSVQIHDEQQKCYTVNIKKSRRKTISCIVRGNGDMEIRLPYHVPFSFACDYVREKKDWFINKHKQILQKKSTIITPQYTKDSPIHILGKAYTIKTAIAVQKSIKIKDDILWVYTHSAQEKLIKEQIIKGLTDMAIDVFNKQLQAALTHFDDSIAHKLKPLKIRRMKSSWGNMRKSGLMTLNLALIHTPPECIKFVITHELCHLQHFNHSPQFYKCMDEAMPSWRIYDKQLSAYSALSL